MIKSLDKDSNIYLHIERLENASTALTALEKTGTYLTSNQTDYKQVFNSLHDYCQKHKLANRKERRNIEVVLLDILIPQSMSNERILEFARSFAIKAFDDLPYTAYLVKRGKGTYISFLISERRYMSKSLKIDIVAKSDLYQRVNEKGVKVFAKPTDPLAMCIKKKGTVYSSYSSHFTNKNRAFTGNDSEIFHKISMLKRIAVSILNKLHFVIKRVFFKKINCKEANGNIYRYKNIRDLNDTFLYFEKILNLIEEQLLLGYMEDEIKSLHKLKYKYLARARNMRFRYGKVSLPFHFCMRRDLFRENLESFQEAFDQEIDKLKQELFTCIPAEVATNE